ncbi:hypothetical protein CALCODRAFT_496554 [Calocera cornea HHB12733]|uniref:ditrans,polycis-polyprenyl diphosphate synthase [(2E,6E)-farnesyldiphosphate specific] n=1 Tax=Calocera cornea HHB12733 TaxID=1353952 RepID=A0A165FQZ8_9BASI|nr:hypothetical protein CALCODRAFT_496554 [Calocera cornea HHB12733]
MSLYAIILLVLHLARAVVNVSTSLISRFGHRPAPKPLRAERKRLPKHLAVCFQDAEREDAQVLLESCVRVEKWAREIGVKEVSFYDRKGVLQLHQTILRELLPPSVSPISTPPSRLLDIELPPTPPISAKPTPPSSIDGLSDSDTPTTKRTLRNRRKVMSSHPLDTVDEIPRYPPPKVNVLSFDQSKPLIAQVAQTLALRRQAHPTLSQSVYIADIDELAKASFASPDLLLVHPTRPATLSPWVIIPRPLELDGFPPWHIDLTEMYYEPPVFRLPIPRIWEGRWRVPGEVVREGEFLRTLESYGKAEMRKGR